MLYSNTEYNVIYVDPSIGTAGDGSTPALALADLPASAGELADNTCYLIRRTDGTACRLPSGTNDSLRRILLMGMPFPSDPLYGFAPEEAKAAWGPDTARHANIRATNGSQSLVSNQLECLLLHRLNMARSGVSSVSSYLIASYQTSESKGVFAVRNCRFGVEGVEPDAEGRPGVPYTNGAMCAYLRFGQARLLDIRDCAVDYRSGTRYYGIFCYAADILSVSGLRMNILAHSNSDYSYSCACLSESTRGQMEATIDGVQVKYLVNGSDSRYLPIAIQLYGTPHIRVSNVTAATEDATPDSHPETLRLSGSLVRLSYIHDFTVRDVEADLRHVWQIDQPVVHIYHNLQGNFAGCEKEVSGIRISCGSDPAVAIGGSRSYGDARGFSSSQSLLNIEYSSGDRSSCYPKVCTAHGLELRNPRGISLCACMARITDAVLEGGAHLSGCLADIASISTWFPGHALRLANYSHARVGEIAVNTENAEYPYNSDTVVVCNDGDYAGNAYVERCNVPLCPAQLSTSAGDTHVARACGNAGETGHYTMLSRNVVADTWNVHRTGGAAACLKLRNDACDTGNTMTLGRKPFCGLLLTPETTGRHILRMHAAFKGFDSLEALQRRLIVTATVDENGSPRVYTSSADGLWRDDSDAEWNNDSDLTQKALEIPLDITTLSAVDVRIHYGWYSATGFVYIDPAIELEATEQ